MKKPQKKRFLDKQCSFLSFNAHRLPKKKKSFKRKEGLVFDTPFAFILIPFVQIMTSTATALVRDNFDSISEVKSEANCVYHKC